MSGEPKYPGLLERIKEALNARRQIEVAKQLGVTPASVSDWKTTGKVSVATLLKIAQLSNASINWLLTGVGPKFLPTVKPKETTTPDNQDPTPENAGNAE